jgi:hypothetical protein
MRLHLRRYWGLVALVVVIPITAWAVPNLDWWSTASHGRTDNSLSRGGCVTFEFCNTTVPEGFGTCADDNTNEPRHVFVGGQDITWQFETDVAGGSTAAQLNLLACTRPDGDGNGAPDLLSCGNLNFLDTDADGIPDDNTLDGGLTNGRRGSLDAVRVAGWLGIDTITRPAPNEVAELVICSTL